MSAPSARVRKDGVVVFAGSWQWLHPWVRRERPGFAPEGYSLVLGKWRGQEPVWVAVRREPPPGGTRFGRQTSGPGWLYVAAAGGGWYHVRFDRRFFETALRRGHGTAQTRWNAATGEFAVDCYVDEEPACEMASFAKADAAFAAAAAYNAGVRS